MLGTRDTETEFFVLGQGPARCDGFPSLDNPRYGRKSFHEDMHMVRHDAPRDESIPLAVKVPERIPHLGRHFRMTECTTTHSDIQPLLDSLAALSTAQRLGELGQFLLQAREFFLWQAVSQSKGDGLQQPSRIAMGQIASRIPFLTRIGCANVPRNADVPVGIFTPDFRWLHVFYGSFTRGRRGRRRSGWSRRGSPASLARCVPSKILRQA